MLGYALIGALASIFYYIGNHEYYDKGWLLAVISVLLSFGVSYLLPVGFIGIIGVNVLFYLGIMIYNIISKRPPGSRSGF
jgi:hypothetical protein